MIVVTPDQAFLGNGHCIICQNGFDRHTQTITLDTLYDAEIPGHVLDGRKYVCQGCLSDIAQACGFMRAGEVAELKAQMEDFKREYQKVQDAVRINVAELSEKLFHTLPVLPNIDFVVPSLQVADAEHKEDTKPKRGRPKAESTF